MFNISLQEWLIRLSPSRSSSNEDIDKQRKPQNGGGRAPLGDDTPGFSGQDPNLTAKYYLAVTYKKNDGEFISREEVFQEYITFCGENKLKPLPRNVFNKIIRLVFPGVSARGRKGQRGNQYYIYYDLTKRNDNSKPEPESLKTILKNKELPVEDIQIPEGYILPKGCTTKEYSHFCSLYFDHLEAFLTHVKSLEFHCTPDLWQSFWQRNEDFTSDEILPKEILIALSGCQFVQEFIKNTDMKFYQLAIDALIPNVLNRFPKPYHDCLQVFCQKMTHEVNDAIKDYPISLVNIKNDSLRGFNKVINAYLELDILASEARPLLQDNLVTQEIQNTLNKINFENFYEEAYTICQCDRSLVKDLLEELKLSFLYFKKIEDWTNKLDIMIINFLLRHKNISISDANQDLILKLSVYGLYLGKQLLILGSSSHPSFTKIELFLRTYVCFTLRLKLASKNEQSVVATMNPESTGRINNKKRKLSE